jgi:hypothetical protein
MVTTGDQRAQEACLALEGLCQARLVRGFSLTGGRVGVKVMAPSAMAGDKRFAAEGTDR